MVSVMVRRRDDVCTQEDLLMEKGCRLNPRQTATGLSPREFLLHAPPDVSSQEAGLVVNGQTYLHTSFMTRVVRRAK